jgi:hypothetical protein
MAIATMGIAHTAMADMRAIIAYAGKQQEPIFDNEKRRSPGKRRFFCL